MTAPNLKPKARATARLRKPRDRINSDRRTKPSLTSSREPVPFDQAISNFLSLSEVICIEDDLDDPALALVLECAKSHRAKLYTANLLIAPGTAMAAGGIISCFKDKSYKGLAVGLVGGLALAPALWLRHNRSEPNLDQLLKLASPKRRKFLSGLFQFKAALERRDVVAYERTTYTRGKGRFRQIDPSMFHADHAMAALIGGNEYWSCVKLDTSFRHQAPTSELLFDIGAHRASMFVDGKLLSDMTATQFDRAKDIIFSSPAGNKTLLKHINHIEHFRSLNPKDYPRVEDRVAAVAAMVGVGVGESSLRQLVSGNLDHFERKLRQIEFPQNF